MIPSGNQSLGNIHFKWRLRPLYDRSFLCYK